MTQHRSRILWRLALLGMLVICTKTLQGQTRTEPFEFTHNGHILSGLLDLPAGQEATAVVVIVQGYGKSNTVAGNWYADLRASFTRLGIAACIWDKPGCGKSEGTFDINQPVESSASEALAAIRALRTRKVAGAHTIGLWGISRAGWICPLIIQQDSSIAYWISVSGTDDKENFGYLLERNLLIEGRSAEQTSRLVAEWRQGNAVFMTGGSYADYQKATPTLRLDPFWLFVTGQPETEEGYRQKQMAFAQSKPAIDSATGLLIYITDFDRMLKKIKCPVLAIFGENDTNVNWKSTRDLYQKTIGRNNRLAIRTFPNCNHNIKTCVTGGLRETLERSSTYQPPCEGYFDTMAEWLMAQKLTSGKALHKQPR